MAKDTRVVRRDVGSFWRVLAACTLATMLCSGCAGSPAKARPAFAETDIRDENLDVLFATEFPVATKGEAIARANEAMKSGDVEGGLFFYVKALMFDPSDAELLIRIARLHEFRHNPVLAVRAYTLAIKADPDNVEALEGRGLLMLTAGEELYAEQDLRRAVALEATAWRAWNGLGLLAARNDEHEDAVRLFTAAIDYKPDLPILLNNRGYSRIQVRDFANAQADLSRAAAAGYDKAWMNLGAMFAGNGRYEDAVKAYTEVLDEAEALNRTGAAAAQRRDFKIATKLFEQAINVSPVYFPDAEQNLAQVMLAE
jgi:Flp pilus assembly protein TadD